MPSNQTPNYSLSQWVKSDQVRMEDFNADNAKIDGALGELTETAAAHTALLAGLGNCQIEHFTYTGDGQYGPGHPTVLSFSRQPLFVMVFGYNECVLDSPLLKRFVCITNRLYQDENTHYSTWREKQLSFYSNSQSTGNYGYDNARAQMNAKDQKYLVVAFFAMGEE